MVLNFCISIFRFQLFSVDDAATFPGFMTLQILQLGIYILLWKRQAVLLQSFK